MKQTGFYILLLSQSILIFGASERGRLIEKSGYAEFQSKLSFEQNNSFVLDSKFEIPGDAQEKTSRKMRAIALICVQSNDMQSKKTISKQLKLFFKHTAERFLPQLKKVLEDESTGACAILMNKASDEDLSQLSHVQSLALHLDCEGLEGSVQITFDSTSRFPAMLQTAFSKRQWHSSLHLSASKPHIMGSVNMCLAQESATFRQEHESDLHMLIFHKSSSLE